MVIDGGLLVRLNDTPKRPRNALPRALVEHSSLLALEPNTGKPLWRARNVIASSAIPIPIELNGTTSLVMAYDGVVDWTWAIVSNGRIITIDQCTLMFQLKDSRIEQLPGKLPVDLASGDVCSIRPAIADRRLFVCTSDGLACGNLCKPVVERGRRLSDFPDIQTSSHEPSEGSNPTAG